MKDRDGVLESHRTLVLACVGLATTAVLLLLRPSSYDDSRTAVITNQNPFTFTVDFGEAVGMRIADTVHYQTDTAEGALEYAKMLPSGGHLVYISDPDSKSSNPNPTPIPHTVTLFHQMKCLDIIRDQYARQLQSALSNDTTTEPGPRVHTCMNYLRQTILCRQNLRIEPVKNTVGTAVRGYDAVCRDWTKVYAEAERNYRAYGEWVRRQNTTVAS